MLTPSQPRCTAPWSRSCATTDCTIFDGTAKPMPMLPPDGEKIAVFTPTTSPAALNSGPPELPGLIDASVWMKSS